MLTMRRATPFRVTKLKQLWRLVRESDAEPLSGQPQIPVVAAAHETAITFIGHSSFLIQTGGQGLLIDPVFANRLVVLRRQRRPGVLIQDLPAVNVVMLTHAHMDHLNRPSLRAITREMRRRGLAAPIAIVPRSVKDLVRTLGFSAVHELDWWQPMVHGGLTITATPAKHWGARMFRDTHRGFGGYNIRSADGPSIWHSGDTAYFSGFREIGAQLRPDVALLPIGAYFPDSYRAVHTSPEEALQAFTDSGAGWMIPMHYGTFRLGREPMTEPLPRLLAAADGAGLKENILPLEEGETWVVPPSAVLPHAPGSLQETWAASGA